jgi:hypothetical protein
MGESLEDSDRFYSQFTELYSFEYLDAEIEEDRYEDDYYHEFSYEDMVLEIFLEYDAVPDEEYDPYISDYMDVTTNISSAPTCNNKYKVAHDLFA